MKNIVIVLFAFYSISASCQKDSTNAKFHLKIGEFICLSDYTYTYGNNIVRVNPYHNTSFNGGLSFKFTEGNLDFMKIRVEFNSYKTPLLGNSRIYEEFIRMPVLAPLINRKFANQNWSFNFYIGFQFSALLRQGIALDTASAYDFSKSKAFSYYKLGATDEFVFNYSTSKIVHSFGLRSSFDVPSLYIRGNKDAIIINRYTSVGVFYAIYL